MRAWILAAALLGSACSSNGDSGDKTDPNAGTGGVPAGSGGIAAMPNGSGGAMSMMMNPGTGTGGMHASGSGGMQSAGSGGTQSSGSGGMQAAGSGGSTSMADAGDAKDGGAMPGPGGFPRGDDVNTDRMGPYKFDSYTDGLDDPEYSSSVLYYPTDAPPPFAVVAFAPGYTATKDDYKDFLGPLLASHGIVILLTTPTDTNSDQPPARGDDLKAALKHLVAENEREGSPVKGKLAADRACITGQSMGGGGTLWAATDLGAMIRCAVPLQPWQPSQSFDKIIAPTMFIAAQNDTVAGVAQNAKFFYDSMPASTIKYYCEFAGADHFLTTNDLGTAYDVQSKYMIAFYKVYLEDDMRYLDVLNAPMDPALSMYLKAP